MLVDPVFDHPARPRNEVGVGPRVLVHDTETGPANAWGVAVAGEVGLEEVVSGGARIVVLEHRDRTPEGPSTVGFASVEAWAGFAAYRLGFPWRVFLTPELAGGAVRSPTTDAWSAHVRAELRAGVGFEGLPTLTFFAKQGLEVRVAGPGRGLAWVSTYGLGYGFNRRVSALLEVATRFDGRREEVLLGPAVHFAPVRGWRVDLGVRIPVAGRGGTDLRAEAVLVVRREFYPGSW